MAKFRFSAATIRSLNKLLDEGFVLKSSLSKSAKAEIDVLLDNSILRVEGKRIVVNREPELLELMAATPDSPEELDHASAAKLFGDAHKGGRQKQFAILVRSRGDCVWRRLDSDVSVSVSDICDKTGIASIVIEPSDDWYSDETIAFVENDFCLWNCQRFPLPEEVTSVIAYHGMADSRLIDWLGFRKRAPKVFWCPDYDYVGLNNYLRASTKADVQLWVPPTFDLLLESTAVNPERLRKQKHLVESLRQSNDPDVQKVLSSLMAAGGGIDHEAFIE
ncbi:hypothetical protein FKG94_13895 [Exilibacterium tricleocarpae]|uniref:Wadjet protein JetD C-terminal domain-containing protein n=1 Tax=Exilibacterium tricleocarpae TaxID=2591008 RepID=A0A545TLP4_9GAMM|nr:hypothetical protein [Exilibacterium tricleocarpae]TQV78160.1 hypothetical protein FKG94_13895 [Exilibacterium tricleocarpae]